MPRVSTAFAAAATLALVASCARAPVRGAPLVPAEVVWPRPPAAPRARLAKVLPDPAAPRPHRAWWKVALEWVAGVESTDGGDQVLARPFGLAFGPGGLYVADPDGARVARIDDRGALTELSCDAYPWGSPIALAVGADGSLFVADAGAGRIVRWSPGGCRRLGHALVERPTGIAVAHGLIWVADPPRHQVLVLSPDGEVVRRIGEPGEGTGRFHYPTAVAVGGDGEVLVVDALNFRVVRLGPDGAWLGEFGTRGDEAGEFARPKAVAVDARGDVFVSDAQRDEVLAFAPDGTFRYGIGETGTDPGQFTNAAGVAVSGDRLAVADSQNHRIQVFELIGGTP